jgi:hypothetical protein
MPTAVHFTKGVSEHSVEEFIALSGAGTQRCHAKLNLLMEIPMTSTPPYVSFVLQVLEEVPGDRLSKAAAGLQQGTLHVINVRQTKDLLLAEVTGESGQTYWVYYVRTRLVCECRDFRFRNHPCKHLAAVALRVRRHAPDIETPDGEAERPAIAHAGRLSAQRLSPPRQRKEGNRPLAAKVRRSA